MKFDKIIEEAEENLKFQGLKGFVQQHQFEKMDDDEIKLVETGEKKVVTYPPNIYVPRESLIKTLGTPYNSGTRYKGPSLPGMEIYHFLIKFKDGLGVYIEAFDNKRPGGFTDSDYISCSFVIDDKFTKEYIQQNIEELTDRIISILPGSRKQNL